MLLLTAFAASAAGLGPQALAAAAPAAPARVLAQSVSFTSPADGFLLGAVRCGTGYCTALRRTTDRGRRWTARPAPPARLATGVGGSAVSALVAADAEDLFAFDPGLWVSHDAGGHWHAIHLPGTVAALAATDGRVYAAVTPCAEAGPTCQRPGSLYTSAAIADGWRLIAGVSLPVGATPILSVSGRTVAALTAGPGRSTLRVTTDGLHFGKRRSPCAPPLTGPAGLAAGGPRALAVLCAGNAGAGSVEKSVFVSSNAGQTFRRVANAPLGGDPVQLAAASPTTLLVSAASGASWLYRTVGPDRFWTAAREVGDGGVGFTGLTFVDQLHGAVVYGRATLAEVLAPRAPAGLGTVYLTNTGGRTWYPTPA